MWRLGMSAGMGQSLAQLVRFSLTWTLSNIWKISSISSIFSNQSYQRHIQHLEALGLEQRPFQHGSRLSSLLGDDLKKTWGHDYPWLHRLKDCRGSWDARDFASTRCISWTAGKQHLTPRFDACDSCFMLFLHLRSSTWSLKREVTKAVRISAKWPSRSPKDMWRRMIHRRHPGLLKRLEIACGLETLFGIRNDETWRLNMWILGKRWIPGLETLLRAWLGERLWKDKEEKLLLGRQGKTNRWGLNLWINICEMSDRYGNVV